MRTSGFCVLLVADDAVVGTAMVAVGLWHEVTISPERRHEP